jgi:hypothetical protein
LPTLSELSATAGSETLALGGDPAGASTSARPKNDSCG